MSSSTGKRGRQRRRVVWDEDNLAHLEETKTPKQKITEPKTPFHTLDPADGSALSPMHLPHSDTEGAPGLNPEQVRSALTEVAHQQETQVDRRSRRRGGGGWTSSEDEGDQEWANESGSAGGEGPSVTFEGTEEYYGSESGEDKEFQEHRKQHYDEFRKLKQLRTQDKKTDTEEEGGEQNNNGDKADKKMDTEEEGEGNANNGEQNKGEGGAAKAAASGHTGPTAPVAAGTGNSTVPVVGIVAGETGLGESTEQGHSGGAGSVGDDANGSRAGSECNGSADGASGEPNGQTQL